MATTTQKKMPAKPRGRSKDTVDLLHDNLVLTKTELSDRLDRVEELADQNERDIVHEKWQIDRLQKFVGQPSLLDEEEEPDIPAKVIKQPCGCGQGGTAPAEIFMWGMMTGICLVAAVLVHQASRSRRFYFGE